MASTSSRVQTPSAFQRQPWAWTSLATDSAGTPSSRAATSAAFLVGVTTRVARPSAAAVVMAAPSMVVLPAPAAPSTITSGSVDAIAPAASACVSSSPLAAASVVTSGWPALPLVSVAVVSRSRSLVSAAMTWRVVRWATCSGREVSGGRTERQSLTARSVVRLTSSRSSIGVARTPYSVTIRVTCSCTGVACPGRRGRGATVKRAGSDGLDLQVVNAERSVRGQLTLQERGRVVPGVGELSPPAVLVGEGAGPLLWPVLGPRRSDHPSVDDGTGLLARVRLLPGGFQLERGSSRPGRRAWTSPC